jgi:hypothetical protein
VLGQPTSSASGQVRDVGGADLGVGVLAVVGLVGQAEAGLHQVRQVARRVLGVGGDEHREQRGALARSRRPSTAASSARVPAAATSSSRGRSGAVPSASIRSTSMNEA